MCDVLCIVLQNRQYGQVWRRLTNVLSGGTIRTEVTLRLLGEKQFSTGLVSDQSGANRYILAATEWYMYDRANKKYALQFANHPDQDRDDKTVVNGSTLSYLVLFYSYLFSTHQRTSHFSLLSY